MRDERGAAAVAVFGQVRPGRGTQTVELQRQGPDGSWATVPSQPAGGAEPRAALRHRRPGPVRGGSWPTGPGRYRARWLKPGGGAQVSPAADGRPAAAAGGGAAAALTRWATTAGPARASAGRAPHRHADRGHQADGGRAAPEHAPAPGASDRPTRSRRPRAHAGRPGRAPRLRAPCRRPAAAERGALADVRCYRRPRRCRPRRPAARAARPSPAARVGRGPWTPDPRIVPGTSVHEREASSCTTPGPPRSSRMPASTSRMIPVTEVATRAPVWGIWAARATR